MKRIAKVCQSMLLSVSTPGFERKSDRHAIKTDIVSISSFFSRQSIFLIVDPPAPMICMQRKCRRSNPAQRVRFEKEKQHHRSIGRRLRRMTSWCCFDVVEARRVELLSENASKGTSPGADACFGIPHPCFPRYRPNRQDGKSGSFIMHGALKALRAHVRLSSTPRFRARGTSRRGRVTALSRRRRATLSLFFNL